MLLSERLDSERPTAAGRFIKPVMALAITALLVGPAIGAPFDQLVYENDYSSVAEGEQPEDWTGSAPNWAVDPENEDGTRDYRWKGPPFDNAPDENVPSIYEGNLNNGAPASSLTDSRVVGTYINSSSAVSGVTSRYTDENNHYILRVGGQGSDPDDTLEIVELDGGNFTSLAESEPGSVDEDGTIEFIVEGDTLTGHWYDADSAAGEPDVTLTATDTSHDSGTFGLRGIKPGGGGGAFLSREISVYAPEPTSLGLLGVGASLVLVRRRAKLR